MFNDGGAPRRFVHISLAFADFPQLPDIFYIHFLSDAVLRVFLGLPKGLSKSHMYALRAWTHWFMRRASRIRPDSLKADWLSGSTLSWARGFYYFFDFIFFSGKTSLFFRTRVFFGTGRTLAVGRFDFAASTGKLLIYLFSGRNLFITRILALKINVLFGVILHYFLYNVLYYYIIDFLHVFYLKCPKIYDKWLIYRMF